MCAPISRWDPRRGEIPNDHGRVPIDPVGGFLPLVKRNRQKHASAFGCTHLSVLRGISESTGSQLSDIARSSPDRRCERVVVGRRGVMCDCCAAEIVRELYGLVGAGPPSLGINVALGWRGVVRRTLRLLAR